MHVDCSLAEKFHYYRNKYLYMCVSIHRTLNVKDDDDDDDDVDVKQKKIRASIINIVY